MTSAGSTSELQIRGVQYRDFEAAHTLLRSVEDWSSHSTLLSLPGKTQTLRHSPAQNLSLFPRRSLIRTYTALRQGDVLGVIQVGPCNKAQTTWKIHAIAVQPEHSFCDIGTALIRHCLESVYEAHTWLVELDVNHNDLIGIYRSNGFQPIAHATQWSIESADLATLAR